MREHASLRDRLRWKVPIFFATATTLSLLVGFVFGLDRDGLLIIGIFGYVFALFFTLDALGFIKDGLLGPRKPAEDRVKELVSALTESTKVISEIEREVKSRSALAERLQSDVQRHEELLSLNRAEVEAVAQTLRQEVRREGRRSFWTSFLLNCFFFGLGVVVTLVFS